VQKADDRGLDLHGLADRVDGVGEHLVEVLVAGHGAGGFVEHRELTHALPRLVLLVALAGDGVGDEVEKVDRGAAVGAEGQLGTVAQLGFLHRVECEVVGQVLQHVQALRVGLRRAGFDGDGTDLYAGDGDGRDKTRLVFGGVVASAAGTSPAAGSAAVG